MGGASAEKKMEEAAVHALLSKVGCARRRMFSLKKAFKSVAKKAASSGKKMACKAFESKCPSACNSAIDQVMTQMKQHKIPFPGECAKTVGKDVCAKMCKEACH